MSLFSLNKINGKAVLPGTEVKGFFHAINLIETSLIELQQIAKNIIPDTLINKGLKEAISQYCESINQTGLLKINFQFIGEFKRINKDFEIDIFWIFQELINNTCRHSKASKLLVQIIQEPKRLSLIVEDNGIGFDMDNINNSNGIGIKRIKSMVESFNGIMDIYSQPGNGSEFTIEFST